MVEELTLPSPAKALFQSVRGVLDALIRPISPGGTMGRLGGGTALAAHWRHRRGATATRASADRRRPGARCFLRLANARTALYPCGS